MQHKILYQEDLPSLQSALLLATKSSPFTKNKKVEILAIFGGQGHDDYFPELRVLFEVYGGLCRDFIEQQVYFFLLSLIALESPFP